MTTVKRYAPAFECLGFVEATTKSGERRYIIRRQDGSTQWLRPMQMHGLAFLTSLYPDIGYWRSRHPKRCRSGVDIQDAMTWIVRECHRVGLYQIDPYQNGTSEGSR